MEQKHSDCVVKIWSEDILLRTALENFLFNLDKTDSELPGTLATGFQLWHKLLRRWARNSCPVPVGFITRDLLIYEHIQLESLVPALICGHLKYYCDLSRAPEAALEVAPTQLEWPVRSLAAFVSVCDSESMKWLIEQLHPSPKVLSQALLHSVSFCVRCRYDHGFSNFTDQSRAEIFCAVGLLVASGIDVNARDGPAETPLIELLLATWLDSGCDRACGRGRMAVIIACLYELELDLLVPIHVSSEIQLHELDDWLLSGCYADLQTVFDWLLYWDAVSDNPDIEALF